MRPFFSAPDGHDPECQEQAYDALVFRGAVRPVATLDGELPVSYPNRLELTEHGREGERRSAKEATRLDRPGSGARANRVSGWAAQTIRPICRLFLDLPFDRDWLRLRVPGIRTDTYSRAFRRLDRGAIKRYQDQRIFFAPLAWTLPPEAGSSALTVKLQTGADDAQRVARPYQVRFAWVGWERREREYVLAEIEDARAEACAEDGHAKGNPETPRWRDQTEAWLFFLGVQDQADDAVFVVGEHQLACCPYAKLRTPRRL